MQSKSPAFQFYPKQWMGDDKVIQMDWLTRGIHHHLMCFAWQQDEPATLPNNGDFLLKILENSGEKISKKRWKDKIFPQLLTSWKTWDDDPSRLIQNGLRREYIKQKALSAKACKGAKTKRDRAVKALIDDSHKDVMKLEDEDEDEVKEVKDLDNKKHLKIEEEKNESMQDSADAGKPVSGAGPVSKPEVRDRVEEFLVFAQKTHERERKALLMIRGAADREKIKLLFDGGIDQKTLSFAWREFLADEGDYFQETDAPHNIAVFHGQVETGHYLEAAARRISSRKAHARPQPPPEGLTKPREPVNPKITGLWDKCLGKIKVQIAPESFASWFEPTYARSLESGLLTVAVPNQFYRKCLIENYRDLIEKTLHGIRDGPLLVDFCIEADRVQLDTG